MQHFWRKTMAKRTSFFYALLLGLVFWTFTSYGTVYRYREGSFVIKKPYAFADSVVLTRNTTCEGDDCGDDDNDDDGRSSSVLRVMFAVRNNYGGNTMVYRGALFFIVDRASSPNSQLFIGKNGMVVVVDPIDGRMIFNTVSSLRGSGALILGKGEFYIGNVHRPAIDGTFSGSISGLGRIVKRGSDVLILTGNNSYENGTLIQDGIIRIHHPHNLGSGLVTLEKGTLQIADDVTLPQSLLVTEEGTIDIFPGKELVMQGNVHVNGEWIKSNSGSLALSKNIDIEQGRLVVEEGSVRTFEDGLFLEHVFLADRENVVLDCNGFSVRLGRVNGGGSSGGDIVLGGGTLIVDGDEDSFFQGSISGRGDLEKKGSGMLSLKGENAYAGKTFLRGGFLRVFDDKNFGSGEVVFNGGNLEVADSMILFRNFRFLQDGIVKVSADKDFSLTGNLFGTGSFKKRGDGVFSFQGSGMPGGKFFIDEGIFRMNKPYPFSADSVIELADRQGVALDMNNFSATIASISGGGRNGGNVLLGTGSLIVRNVEDKVFSGRLIGSGILVKDGPGTLKLLGQNNTSDFQLDVMDGLVYAESQENIGRGKIIFNGGGLQIQQDAELSQDMKFVLRGVINVPINSTMTLSGSLFGEGDLIKQGQGTLIIGEGGGSGHRYSGVIELEQGELKVLSEILSSVNISSYGKLSGIGAVWSVLNFGEVSPGLSIGTLYIRGGFVQTPSGVLVIELDPSGAGDLLVVGRRAKLAGTLRVIAPGDYYDGQTFTILQAANGVEGVFQQVNITHDPGIDFAVNYASDFVALIASNSVQPPPPIPPIDPSMPFDVTNLWGNSWVIAYYLFGPSSPIARNHPYVQELLALCPTLTTECTEILHSISPVQFSAFPWIELEQNYRIGETFFDGYYLHRPFSFEELEACEREKRQKLEARQQGQRQQGGWFRSLREHPHPRAKKTVSEGECHKRMRITRLSGLGIFSRMKYEAVDFPDWSLDSGGVSAVWEYVNPNDMLFLAGLGYTHGRLSWPRRGHAIVNSGYIGAGIGYYSRHLQLAGLILGAGNWYEASREILLPSVPSAKHKHFSWDTSGTIFVRIVPNEFPVVEINPLFIVDLFNGFEPKYEEEGAGLFNAVVLNKYSFCVRSLIGVELTKNIPYSSAQGRVWIIPKLHFGWINASFYTDTKYTAYFAEEKTSILPDRMYTIQGPEKVLQYFHILGELDVVSSMGGWQIAYIGDLGQKNHIHQIRTVFFIVF